MEPPSTRVRLIAFRVDRQAALPQQLPPVPAILRLVQIQAAVFACQRAIAVFSELDHRTADPLDGCMPLAPSFDTVGWFARDARLLQRVGAVFYPSADSLDGRFLFADGLLALCDGAVSEIFQNAISRIEGQIDYLGRIEFGSELTTGSRPFAFCKVQKSGKFTVSGF